MKKVLFLISKVFLLIFLSFVAMLIFKFCDYVLYNASHAKGEISHAYIRAVLFDEFMAEYTTGTMYDIRFYDLAKIPNQQERFEAYKLYMLYSKQLFNNGGLTVSFFEFVIGDERLKFSKYLQEYKLHNKEYYFLSKDKKEIINFGIENFGQIMYDENGSVIKYE
jgi:hypothetical protein